MTKNSITQWGQTKSGLFVKPRHIWWMGVLIFAPGFVVWVVVITLGVVNGTFSGSFDFHSIQRLYLPFLAATVGVFVPFACMRFFKDASTKVIWVMFVTYLVAMLAWGIADIRAENYQLGGHEFPDNIQEGDHAHYFHAYYTWYFLPYKLIENGVAANDKQ